jgi:hypothetical protein
MVYGEISLTKEDILRRVTEEEIFRHYIGDFTLGKVFKSPLRSDDKHPSFLISYRGKTLSFIDFAVGLKGSCFDFVMVFFNISFTEALTKISYDLGLSSLPANYQKQQLVHNLTQPQRVIIQIKSRPFSQADIAYWNSYGVTINTLILYNVKSMDFYWINGKMIAVKPNELAFAYKISPYTYKIYKPYSEDKWVNNGGSILHGIKQLSDQRDLLVITKALKDVMLLREIGIDSICPASEAQHLKDLPAGYNRYLVVYDSDENGIEYAKNTGLDYKIPPKKDLSDWYKEDRSYEDIKRFINH